MTPWKVLLLSLATSSTHTISPSPTVMSLNTCTNRRSHDFTYKCPVSFCAAAETASRDCGQQRFPCLGGSSVSVPARTLLLVAVKTLRLCTSSFLNGPRAFSHASSTNLRTNQELISVTTLTPPPPPLLSVTALWAQRRFTTEALHELKTSFYLLKVVDHEEDVGVAHLGLLPFAVHGMFTRRCEHFLWAQEGEIKWDKSRVGWEKVGGFISSSCCRAAYLTFLLVDVDISCVWARADGARHHIVQLEEGAGFRLVRTTKNSLKDSFFKLYCSAPSEGWGSGRRSPPSRCQGHQGPEASWSPSCRPPPPPETQHKASISTTSEHTYHQTQLLQPYFLPDSLSYFLFFPIHPAYTHTSFLPPLFPCPLGEFLWSWGKYKFSTSQPSYHSETI